MSNFTNEHEKSPCMAVAINEYSIFYMILSQYFTSHPYFLNLLCDEECLALWLQNDGGNLFANNKKLLAIRESLSAADTLTTITHVQALVNHKEKIWFFIICSTT